MRLLAAFALLAGTCYSQQYDVLITGGRVADGSGSLWFYGDIAIANGRIAALGLIPRAEAKLHIDARGLTVAPGFIDIHNHGRRGILETPSAENLIRQGVTTLLEGNDGSSPVPLKPFLEQLNKVPIAVNFGSFAGQGSIREKVMGLQDHRATPEELEGMRGLAREAMRDGAFGLSTGLFYVPGNFTPAEEVVELAKAVGEYGGMHISHMRNEAAEIEDSVRETIRIGEEGGLPTQVSHHKIIGRKNWGSSEETLRLVEEARERGVDVTVDQYPYTASSTGISALFPQWSLEGGREALLERLAAPEQRARIKAEMVTRIVEDRGGGDPKNVVIASCPFDASFAGKSLAELAIQEGRKPSPEEAAEVAIGLQKRGNCTAVYHAIGEEDVDRIMQRPFTMIASDGGIVRMEQGAPHPRNYGTFARVLGEYVRERGIVTLEDAIRKMTSFPAARLKIWDRGLLRPGMMADVVVFDADKVKDEATFEKPHQYATGFRHVFVNGKAVLLDAQMTGELPGRVLYGPGAATSP